MATSTVVSHRATAEVRIPIASKKAVTIVTRKTYVAVAEIIKAARHFATTEESRDLLMFVVVKMADLFSKDSSLFDRERFYEATHDETTKAGR